MPRIDVDVGVLIEARDERRVVTARVIAHKAVKLSGYIIFIEYSAQNSSLRVASMVAVEVAEGDNNIVLFKVGICSSVSDSSVPQGPALSTATRR